MKEKRKNRTILSSTFARIVSFFLLAISFIVGVGGIALTILLWEEDAYTSGMTSLIKDLMRSEVVWDDVNYVKTLYQENDIEGLEAYLEQRNIAVEIYNPNVKDGEKMILLWGNYDGFETKYSFNCFTEIYVMTEKIIYEDYSMIPNKVLMDSVDYVPNEDVEEWQDVLFRVYVDDDFPHEDEYHYIHTWGMRFDDWLYAIPIIALFSLFLFLCSFIFLMCSAGHHQGKNGISGGVLYHFHFDVITVIFGFVAIVWLLLFVELLNEGGVIGCLLALLAMAFVVSWLTIYCMEFATELKLGTLFKHTLIYIILRFCGRGIKALCRSVASLVKGVPLIINVLIVYAAFCIVQIMLLTFFCILWGMDGDVLVLCFLEKIVLFPIVLYFALVCKKLQQGSEALAEGQLTYKLDTAKMFFGFKEHGDNLNRIGEGIAVAVDERMKSEHLKTELITNVSHDLKTPLTSIINYADLIGTVAERGISEESDKAQLCEYSEVLLRQSKRLKKLLEDLVEASKATTGNLEVKLESCEISVILSQAIGEYMQRFAEKELILLVKQPEEPVCIQADGRHLWRVFDNLLNNICKYAQENTRVYLTVEPKDDVVEIIFRNMSKYQLDVSAEELQERFVRGDKSRHMEGNGLGLSIAGSLVELQGGSMEIVTDGDLFKVILRFVQE